ncbi:ATP-binding protein [Falsihalocynthiibacter sp. S25ZX9]|uniref:hybrid sensor histidine kinase/response regulator n=1 Tax=Falsihalocynthiibacter sp. S25ZX9 TaxID=3240870 RepID=UPI003510567F
MIKLAWVLPTVLAVLAVEVSFRTGLAIPIPFLIIVVCVVIAGSMGGQRSGLISGLIASLFVFNSYLVGFGPATLTGSLLQVALGSVLFTLLGTLLGRLREQRDTGIQALRDREKTLETSLNEQTEEKNKQVTMVAESEARLKTAIRIARIGLFSYEKSTGTCTFCSEQYAAHFGLMPDEYITKTSGHSPDLSHIHADDLHIIVNAIARLNDGEDQVYEYRALHPDHGIRYISEIVEPVIDENGKVIANTGTSIDVTELRLAEMRLRQSQRIEAVGTLTGGVAHDFNNLLAIILGNLELCLETGRKDDWKARIETAIDATNRGAGLTKNLLSFSRRAHLQPKRLNLNHNVQNTMSWCARVLPKTINIETSLQAGLWDVEVDETSIETSIINILLNARDAMPEGGKVTIETANMRIGEEYMLERGEDIEPGRYVMLAISDTGHGIPAEKLEHVFEPFFTDKGVGRGSGLGLSMVHGFIKQSGGAIRIYSEVGVGTTFKLYFKATTQALVPPKREPHKQFHSPSERVEILLAEDEEEVLLILKRILVNAGYSVTTAATGDEALEIFNTDLRFDLLLTDIVMPGSLQGPALAKAIRLIDPNLPCIFLSGYASEATVHGNGLKPSDIRLMKPASRHELLSAVSKTLSSVNQSN